jgi:hypothetical protein
VATVCSPLLSSPRWRRGCGSRLGVCCSKGRGRPG